MATIMTRSHVDIFWRERAACIGADPRLFETLGDDDDEPPYP